MFGKKEPKIDTRLIFEWIKDKGGGMDTKVRRAKVIGGWLVVVTNAEGIGTTFLPDPEHEWEVTLMKE